MVEGAAKDVRGGSPSDERSAALPPAGAGRFAAMLSAITPRDLVDDMFCDVGALGGECQEAPPDRATSRAYLGPKTAVRSVWPQPKAISRRVRQKLAFHRSGRLSSERRCRSPLKAWLFWLAGDGHIGRLSAPAAWSGCRSPGSLRD
ncbi:hypothetical protein MPC4_110115 [Methylocella tundrae]|uniref:Uncharacterized protein n=1 Tax=Methylocella tundrae TaxID=227605 RepID=A0A8B6M233_METTU|nr:hypothetical protein MPC4_110115 [Methylocella tundrae]